MMDRRSARERADAGTATGRPLAEAFVTESLAVIAEHGLEKLSLRDVARRLGVSHQAPYKHFESRDHLLVEVLRRCFRDFTKALKDRERRPEPIEDLRSLGAAYLRFAGEHPLEYRLMFATPWPDVSEHPDLVRDARFSFEVLVEALSALDRKRDPAQVELDAMFIWTSMHGVASIMESRVIDHLRLSPEMRGRVIPHAMAMLDRALLARDPTNGA